MWDELPEDIHRVIWRWRFVNMGTETLKRMTTTSEDLPFNPNVDMERIHAIHLRLKCYECREWEAVVKQLVAFQKVFEEGKYLEI